MAQKQNPKFVFIVGGVISSVGKGTITASLAKILKTKGFKTTAVKIEAYINVDAGTINPTEHGEVFVTDDGDETDQDVGNYERFIDENIYSENFMTTGRVYLSVIERERNMGYNGEDVEVVPDIPKEVIRRIKKAQKKAHSGVTFIEIGGTIGEYQNILFLEAARMMKLQNPDDVAVVMVSYLPIPPTVGEMKTKPTQYAARSLNTAGVYADFIVCRSQRPIDTRRRDKLALLCNLKDAGDVVSSPDVESIYEVPLMLEKEQLGDKLLKRLKLPVRKSHLQDWEKFVHRIKSVEKKVHIAVVGKYFGTGDFTLADSYISVIESLKHASWFYNHKPALEWVDSEEFERTPQKISRLSQFDGILVPGGFGSRGVDGIIKAIHFARVHNIPYFGICFGMQLACVEIARSLVHLKKAHAVEIDPKTPDPIIHVNPAQAENIKKKKFGGTLRLGAYQCDISRNTKAWKAYGVSSISERHRHRYEFNNAYRDALKKAGVVLSGINSEMDLIEIMEFQNHPWFVGVQFHPEFLSRPLRPHPLYRDFVKACIKHSKRK